MLYVIWSLVFLGVCTVTDAREQKVYSAVCYINILLSILIHVVLKDISYLNVVIGIIMGLLLIGISYITKESIGKGDGMVVLVLGCIMGGSVAMQSTFWGALICMMMSVIGIILGRVKLKSRIPFVPFLFVGEIITLILNR